MEIRKREMELQRNVKREQKVQMDIISDMTRQYKSVFEQLCNQQEKLERRFADNVEEITRLDNKKKALGEET